MLYLHILKLILCDRLAACVEVRGHRSQVSRLVGKQDVSAGRRVPVRLEWRRREGEKMCVCVQIKQCVCVCCYISSCRLMLSFLYNWVFPDESLSLSLFACLLVWVCVFPLTSDFNRHKVKRDGYHDVRQEGLLKLMGWLCRCNDVISVSNL